MALDASHSLAEGFNNPDKSGLLKVLIRCYGLLDTQLLHRHKWWHLAEQRSPSLPYRVALLAQYHAHLEP